jgi:phospholipase/carboxylesterase
VGLSGKSQRTCCTCIGRKIEVKAQTKLSIYHLVRFPVGYPLEAGETLFPAILALHGHGSNERDLIGLSARFPENLFWISGRGPIAYAPDGYDWYPVTQFGKPDPELLAAALERIDGFITELLSAYPIDPHYLFLMGFSQGSMISMSYLLKYPNRIRGVIAQSGYIPPDSGLEVDVEGVKGKPVIMTHGLEDSRMPLEWSEQSRDLLLSYGVDVDYHTFHMDHTITAESLAAIKTWREKQLMKP